MTKRVPPFESFTADDGASDDKRPRRGEMVSEHLNHPAPSSSSSSSSSQHFTSNELPSRSSTIDVLSSSIPLSSAGPTGAASSSNFFANGSNGHQDNNGMILLPNIGGHSNNFGGFHNGGVISNNKCSICLWPVGSARCYHHSHHRPHQLSTR